MIGGIGVDIIEIDRIKKAIERWGDVFLNHIFNQEEIDYAQKHKNSYQHFAARFVAKEAIYKAISVDKKLGWKDMTILNDQNGRPFCRLRNKDCKDKIQISISHCKEYAVANAIVVGKID